MAVAADDSETLREARSALAHVLVWSPELDRARTLLEAEDRAWSDRDERFSANARWYLSLVELQAGRWSLAAEHADQARLVFGQYAARCRNRCFPSHSSLFIAASSSALASSPSTLPLWPP